MGIDGGVSVEEALVLVAAVVQEVFVRAAAVAVFEAPVGGLQRGEELFSEQGGVTFGPVEPDRFSDEPFVLLILLDGVADRGADGQEVEIKGEFELAGVAAEPVGRSRASALRPASATSASVG